MLLPLAICCNRACILDGDELCIIARLTAAPRSPHLLRSILINKNRYSHRMPYAGKKEASLKCNGQGDQTLQSFQVGDDIFCRSDPHHMPSRLVLPFCNLGQGSQGSQGCSLASSIKDLLFRFVDPPPPPLPSMAQFGVQATWRFAIFVPRLNFHFGPTLAQFR